MTGATGLVASQAQNRYAYVDNNPLMHIDPSGYCTFTDANSCEGFSAEANGVSTTLPQEMGGATGFSGAYGTFAFIGTLNVNGTVANSGLSQGGATVDLKNPSGWTLVNWIRGWGTAPMTGGISRTI